MIDMVLQMQLTKPGVSMSDGSYTVLIPQDASGFGKLIQVKSAKGYPCDIILFNEHGLWDRVTERDKPGWSSPLDIKLHTGNGGLGTLICSRYVTAFPTPEALTPLASYEPFFGGQTDLVPKNVGSASSIISYIVRDWGGEIGKTGTYVRSYRWSGHPGPNGPIVYSDLEVYNYVPGYGMVHWTHAKMNAAGNYIVDSDPGIKNTTRPMKVAPPVNQPLVLGLGTLVQPPPVPIPPLGALTFNEAIAKLKALGVL